MPTSLIVEFTEGGVVVSQEYRDDGKLVLNAEKLFSMKTICNDADGSIAQLSWRQRSWVWVNAFLFS